MTNQLPTLEQVIRATQTTRNQVDSWRRLGLLTEPLARIEGRKGINVPYRAALEIGLLAAIMAFKVHPSKAAFLMKIWMPTIETAEDGMAHAVEIERLIHEEGDIASFSLSGDTPLLEMAEAMTPYSTPGDFEGGSTGRPVELTNMPASVCLIFPAAIRRRVDALYQGEGA